MNSSTLTISYGFKDSVRMAITLILALLIYYTLNSSTDTAAKVFSSCFLFILSLLLTFRYSNAINKDKQSIVRKLSFWMPLITLYKKNYKYKNIDFRVIEKLGSRVGARHSDDAVDDFPINDDAPSTFHAYLILDGIRKVYLRPVNFSNWIEFENEFMDYMKS